MFEPNLASRGHFEGDTRRWQDIAIEEQAAVVAGLLASGDRRFPEEETDYRPDDDVAGVLWTHTAGDESGARLSPDERRLSSHYWSGTIPAAVRARRPFPCLRYVGALLPGSGCPLCGGVFPLPFAAAPGAITGGCAPTPEPPILALPELPIDLAPILAFDPGPLFRSLDLRWLTPAEPLERQPAGSVRLVAFNDTPQGAPDAAIVLADLGQGLTPVGNVGQSPPGDPIDPPIGQQSTPFARSAPESSSPIAPAVEARVLSARRQLVWTMRAEGHLRIQHVMGGSTQEFVVQDLASRTTRAMTYRERDDRLYLITTRDEWLWGWFPIEWTELHSMSATPEEIASEGALPLSSLVTHRRWLRVKWHGHAEDRSFALISALDGSLWAMGDRPGWRSGSHFVLRLERQVRRLRRWSHSSTAVVWQETAVAFGDGTLTEVSPASDARGVSLVVQRNGLEELIGYRSDALESLRRGDVERCF